jgi:hypothetical protein
VERLQVIGVDAANLNLEIHLNQCLAGAAGGCKATEAAALAAIAKML